MTSRSEPPEQNSPDAIAGRLKRAIVKIGEQSKSDLRCVTDRYLTCVRPALADRSDSEFPRSVHRHPRDPDRSQVGGFGNVLCFLIGNAILSYYDAVRGIKTPHLLVRVRYVEEVAGDLSRFKVYGTDYDGYILATDEAAAGSDRAKHGLPHT